MFVFVYGSLKKNFKYHYILEDSDSFFIDNCTTRNKFSLYEYKDSGFPYLSKKESFSILGELYEVNNLKSLDRLEGYPHFYDRELVRVKSFSGIFYEAYVYFLKEEINEVNKPSNCWSLEDQSKSSSIFS